MSRKSRREAAAESPQPVARVAVDPGSGGVAFEVVVGFGAALAFPTVLACWNGELPFDTAMLRILSALAVSWVLTNLVLAVFRLTGGSGSQSAAQPSAVEPNAGLPGQYYGDKPDGVGAPPA